MEVLIKWYSGLNIYYKLIPFLILYSTICLVFGSEEASGDEERYIWFAENLLNGFYSPPFPDFNLWNGPGYPAFLALFMFFGIPLHLLLLLNGFLLYFSLIISYKTINLYSSDRSSLFFTFVLGFYFPIFQSLTIFYTESLAWFLISLTCYLFLKTIRQNSFYSKLIIVTSISISYLTMTKVIFGYVIPSVLILSILLLLIPAFRTAAQKSVLIFSLTMIFCLPWLFYTYQLTDKLFYWTNSGGMSLYTMSTPYPGEYGDWQSEKQLLSNPNHTVFIDSILKLKPLSKDEAYKVAAIKNIRNYPGKYLDNYVRNIGRLLFFPSVNAPNSIFAYFAFIPNMFVVVFVIMTIIIAIVNFKKIPQELVIFFLFIFIYLLASSFLSAYRRMFYITMPFWILFISFIFTNFISIKTKKD